MSETENANEDFQAYLKAQEGKPIDERAVAAAGRELELGAKSDFAVVKDEPDRATVLKTFPEGHKPKKRVKKMGQPKQEVVVSPEAKKSLDYFRIREAGRSAKLIEELLAEGKLEPNTPASELPKLLREYHDKLLKGQE